MWRNAIDLTFDEYLLHIQVKFETLFLFFSGTRDGPATEAHVSPV